MQIPCLKKYFSFVSPSLSTTTRLFPCLFLHSLFLLMFFLWHLVKEYNNEILFSDIFQNSFFHHSYFFSFNISNPPIANNNKPALLALYSMIFLFLVAPQLQLKFEFSSSFSDSFSSWERWRQYFHVQHKVKLSALLTITLLDAVVHVITSSTDHVYFSFSASTCYCCWIC